MPRVDLFFLDPETVSLLTDVGVQGAPGRLWRQKVGSNSTICDFILKKEKLCLLSLLTSQEALARL